MKRRVLAGLAGLAGMVGIVLGLGSSGIWDGGKALLLILLGVAGAAAIGIHRPDESSQLFARATWRSNLALGAYTFSVCPSFGSGEAPMAWGMAFGSAAALFLVGPTALDASEEPGERARSTFILRGLSDAQTLLVFGFVAENVPGEEEHGMAWLIGGLLLIVGVFGMLRQASWGVALNMAVCSCLLVWSVFASFVPCGQSFNWPPFFFVLSLLELLAGTTMIFARFIGRPLPALVSANARRVLAYVGIALVLVLCICTQVVFPTIVRVGGRPPYGAFTAEWL